MTYLFSNVFGVWMVLSNFGASLQAFNPDRTLITSGRNVIGIEYTTSGVSVAFWLVLPFGGRKNFKRFNKNL